MIAFNPPGFSNLYELVKVDAENQKDLITVFDTACIDDKD
jgi:hypothetical protein